MSLMPATEVEGRIFFEPAPPKQLMSIFTSSATTTTNKHDKLAQGQRSDVQAFGTDSVLP